MKKARITCCFAFAFIAHSCKKDNAAPPAPGTTAKCAIKSETTGLAGNNGYWEYAFNNKGTPVTIKAFNSAAALVSTTTVGETDFRYTAPSGGESHYAYDANIHTGMPGKLEVSSTNGVGVSTRNHTTYSFFYDVKKRLNKVGMRTNNITTDNEWELNIAYNDKDNVTSLSYEFTTGPRGTFGVTTVTAYDDKPNPYAAISSWKFLSVHFDWGNYDPQPMISALSRNNPLDFTFGAVPNQWKRGMMYTYNGDGFPAEVINKQTSPSGATGSFPQTFAYNCR